MSNPALASPARTSNQPQSRGTSFSSVPRPQATSPTKKKRFSASLDTPTIITPSFLEGDFGASIGSRTASLPQFQEIGPPDLLHVSKYNKSYKKEEGEYHFLTGVDLSSEIAAIAYISTLNFKYMNYNSERHPTCFTYCAYNAFSKEDVRIRKEFPGTGYSLKTIPSDRGKLTTNEVTQKTWDELFVCAIVRSVIIELDDERKLPALVQKSLFQSINASKVIIDKLVQFIYRGHILGASENVFKPSIYENYLLDVLYIIAEITNLSQYAIDAITSLQETIIPKYDLTIIIAKLRFLQNKEIQAIKLIHDRLLTQPRDSFVINEQTRFLLSRGNIELALQTAKKSVEIDPLSFQGWYLLAKVYLYQRDFHSALTVLNNTPMIPLRPKDILKINRKDKLDIPAPNEGKVKAIWEKLKQVYGPGSQNLLRSSPQYEIDAVDPNIVRVNRYQVRGTRKAAYDLLVLIVDCIGWDGLLQTRSEVFVMDNELELGTRNLMKTPENSATLQKRICEKWLEELLNILFEDLRIAVIFDEQLKSNSQSKHSSLEWHLIGLTSLRTHYYNNAVSSLRTTINNEFDIVSAKSLMKLWEAQRLDFEFQSWQRAFNRTRSTAGFEIPMEQLIDVVVKSISYNTRFYNEGQFSILIFLKRFFGVIDVDYIGSRVQILLEKDDIYDWKNVGVIPVYDSLVNVLQMFGEL